MSDPMELRRVHLGPAACALDLGDGSERAEYVNQDYILQRLGRPHRCVNIMYTYYPHDAQWPQRISKACRDMDVAFQWDYPYDDYFPFGADGEPFAQMRDIRRHGQDVLLTLTADCALTDEEIRALARQLRTFGRMKLRLNHECSGNWFTHNKRFSFAEIGAFFARFAAIVREEAPHVSMIFCAGAAQADGTVEQEQAFTPAYRAADSWSTDKYLALHYGWPYNIAEVGGGKYTCSTAEEVYELFQRTALRLREQFGEKPFGTAEINVDGDVTGPLHQAEGVLRLAKLIRERKPAWFHFLSLYQFRDRGRLGLEVEDPNNPAVGIEQPLLRAYRDKVLNDPYFQPTLTLGEAASYPLPLRWGSSEDADGAALTLHLEKTPEFCEMTVEQDIGLMVALNGRWFYKAPQVKTIDLMPAFFDKPLQGPTELALTLFAPPADGENVDDGHTDWQTNAYAVLEQPPKLRIRYEVPGAVVFP